MGSELTILESDAPWGPFSLVHYEWMWHSVETGAYCPRIPLKWFDHEQLSGFLEFDHEKIPPGPTAVGQTGSFYSRIISMPCCRVAASMAP